MFDTLEKDSPQLLPCSAERRAGPTPVPGRTLRRGFLAAAVLVAVLGGNAAGWAQDPGSGAPGLPRLDKSLTANPADWVSRDRLGSTLQMVLTMSVLSLAPAVLLMTTSFIRITVVLGLLRQALGIGQLPSNQVITSISLFMTLLIMTPVWKDVYQDAVAPYTDPQGTMSLEEAWQAGVKPVRKFMSRQIEIAGNSDDVWLFYQYLPEATATPTTYDDVPLQVLLPAFVLSELTTAFLIGFQIYLPFVIVDLVVSSVTMSMGMIMLPPMMISLPMKLLLFVLVDGWNLIVGMLLASFAPYT
ncbi:MAG: flagellar type III secretion system pore protein FliP [Candidatus Anammoximicrobium sp.]|nr:flagellar type III secretion system pore protein FliP [Candidatus Anammoximicrobium sp.]